MGAIIQTFSFAYALAICSILSLNALAGTIDYTGPMPGPGGMTGWVGSDVWYGGVSESNDDTVSRFGAPQSITGNSIDFDPVGFVAQSDNGEGAVTVDSQLNMMVVALPGKVIDNIQFSEAGDTTLNGSPVADFAVTTVTTSIFVDVLEIDGSPVGSPININTSMLFTPSDGDYVLSVDGSPITFTYNTIWTGLAQIDIKQFLIDNNIDFINGATKLGIALDNTLTANSISGSSAFIAKKDFDGLTVTTNIPEPSTALLVMLAISSVAASRRS